MENDMGRIRTIKPEFPESESIGRVSRDARLLLVQLLTIVDDRGRARAHPRYLVGKLYAYDDDAFDLIDVWLKELESEKHIIRYQVEDSHYLEIVNFLKHQKIDKPSPSKIPPPPGTVDEPSETIQQPVAEASPKASRKVGDGPGPVSGPVSEESRVTSGPTIEESFEEFWSIYPKREGPNPKKPAFEKFRSFVNGAPTRAAVAAKEIIDGAKRFAEYARERKIEPRFIPMTQTWLNQCRWEDNKPKEKAPDLVTVFEGTPEWQAWLKAGHSGIKSDFHDPATGRRRDGWKFQSRWPPGYKTSDEIAA